MKKAIALFVLLFVTTVADASAPYSLGADGYYYGSNGLRYTRSSYQTWVPGYYYTRNCCRYYQQGYYKTDYSYALAPLTYRDPDWRTQLLKIAAYRDQAEAKVRLSALEQTQFVESVRELGLSGNFYWQNYGVSTLQNRHIGQYGASGNAVYSSYVNSSVADVYGGADTTILFQQAAALAKDGLAIGAQATDRFSGLIDKERDRAAFAAEIIAKGQAAAQVLQAIQPTASAHVRTTQQQTIITTDRKALAIRACITCHGDAKPEGGYRVSQHWALTPDQQMAVVQNHLLAEEGTEAFMPRALPGQQTKRLPAEVILEFVPIQDRVKLQR